jgi:hypothetical protein
MTSCTVLSGIDAAEKNRTGRTGAIAVQLG